jgi:rSAM/selenodomain-associated transferase 2
MSEPPAQSPALAPAPALSVVIPTLNAAGRLGRCLEEVKRWPGALDLIVVDGGSADDTVAIAHDHGAKVLPSERGRGTQLARGGDAAGHNWLLFLHADTVLESTWVDTAQTFMAMRAADRAAAFRFALDDPAPQARRIERLVAWRCRTFALPYGDQGLLLPRALYQSVGGYRTLPLMEDVDLVRRLKQKVGRENIMVLDAAALTSAVRYRQNGWWLRPARNLFCLFLYYIGVPARWISGLYG